MISKEENKDKKGKKKIDECTDSMKKIRITCFDPDATDSSDDDDDDFFLPTKGKQIVKEIYIPSVGFMSSLEDSGVKNGGKVASSGTKKQSKQRAPPSSLSKGVRERKCGTFATEIWDPFQRKQVWLGSFSPPEEASQVYNGKRMEFDRIRLSKKTKNKSVVECSASENSNANLCTQYSPSSVLEASTSIPVDNGCADKMQIGEETQQPNGEFSENQFMSSSISNELNLGFEENLLYFNVFREQPTLDFLEDSIVTPPLSQQTNLRFGENSLCGNYLGADDMEMIKGMTDESNNGELEFDFTLDEEELAWIDESLIRTP